MPRLLSCIGRLLGRLALLAGLLSVAVVLPSQAASPGRADRHGDPLPDGAVARLGSTRFRGLCDSIHFSADGKTLVGVDGGCRVRVWDADSGKLLHTRPLADRPYRTRWQIRTALSEDGKTLLITEGRLLQMWDLPSGKQLDVRLPTDFRLLTRLAVSNDRRFLVLEDLLKSRFVTEHAGGGFGTLERERRFLLWDTTTGKQRLLGQEKTELGKERLLVPVLSPDGKRLASSSADKGMCMQETATGKQLWRVAGFQPENLTFTPDGRRLIAWSRRGGSAWRVWDAATGRPAPSLPAPGIGDVWTFALSPDGDKLLAPTSTDYVLWDLPAGKELQRWPGARQSGQVAFAPNGRSVVTCDTILRRWDAATGKPLYPDATQWGHVAAARRLFFTPDGKRLASVGEDNTLIVWDVAAGRLHALAFGGASGDERWDWSSDGGTTNRDGWALAPDGSTLFAVDTRLTVHRWSLAEGRQLPPYELRAAHQVEERLDLRAMHVRVSPDGETLTLAGWPRCPEYRFNRYAFSFWDAQTGRLRRWGGDPGQSYRGNHVVLSADGRFVLSDGRLYDTCSGAWRQLQPASGVAEAVGGSTVFSADSRLLAVIGKTGHVWDVASGRPVFDIPQADTYRSMPDDRLVAFSPDGRRLAFVAPQHLIVCDLPTGEVVVKRPVPDNLAGEVDWASGGVRFAPDGRTVATGCRDGTILLWEVPAPGPVGRRRERQAAVLWDDLARDASTGWAAVWRFQENADRAISFLRRRLPAVPKSTVDFGELIALLDSEQFEEREAASRRLRDLGRAAENALRQALEQKPTAEQQRRIETLLARLEHSPQPPPDLRIVRAVAVLEGLNTAAARRLLAEWADGLPGAPLTDEAARAVARLRWRPPSEDR